MELEKFFDRILEIIMNNTWYKGDISIERFIDDAMNLASSFNSEEREFFSTLLSLFNIFSEKKYPGYIMNILSRISIDQKKIVVVPLLADRDLGKTHKSSVYVMTQFKLDIIKSMPIFSGKQLVDDDCFTDDSVVLIVDDFIGTGVTAHNCINRYLKKGIPKEKIRVLTIVIMETGLKKLNKDKIQVDYLVCYKKGIAHYCPPNKQLRFNTINETICERNSIENPFGFGNSQALVSMFNTPNNTFPIFWDRKMRSPLFPRQEYE